MQDFIAISIVIVAAGFLARQAWRTLQRRGGGKCGSCASCPSDDSLKSRPLVTISLDVPK